MKNEQDEQSRGLTARVMIRFAEANHEPYLIFSKAKTTLASSGNTENVCAARRLVFWPWFRSAATRHHHHRYHPSPNGSRLLPAFLLCNPLIRRSREKRFAGGRWPCPVAASYVSDGTRPVDTRAIGVVGERRGVGGGQLRVGAIRGLGIEIHTEEGPSHPRTRNNFLCHASIHRQTLIVQSSKVTELISWRWRPPSPHPRQDTDKKPAADHFIPSAEAWSTGGDLAR